MKTNLKLYLIGIIAMLFANTLLFAQNNQLQGVKKYLDSEIAKGNITNSQDVASLLKPNDITAAGDILYGTEDALSSSSEYVSVAALDATTFVYSYKLGLIEYAVVGTISGTGTSATISYGTPKNYNGGRFTVVTSLDATHFVIVYARGGDNGYAIVGTVSGTTISFGTAVEFESDTAFSNSISTLDATHFVVAYSDQGYSTNYSRAVVGSVSGTDITFGTAVDFYSGDLLYLSVSALDASHFVTAYSASGGQARVASVSGTTITLGAVNQFSSSTVEVSVAGLDATHFVVAYNNSILYSIVGVVSGSTISSYGSAVSPNSSLPSPINVAAINSSKFVVSYCDANNSDKGEAVAASVSGTTITFYSEAIYYNASLNYSYIPYVTVMPNTSGDAQFVVTYIDAANSYGRTRVGAVASVTAAPVELTSFTATSTSSATVVLNWTTATEVNNYGFEVQRAVGQKSFLSQWETIGFIEGHGNSNSPNEYSFIDTDKLSGTVSYRLKQLDVDGAFEYHKVVTVKLNGTMEYKLAQNSPNPFNPSTQISFTIPEAGVVKLNVYNMLGEKVTELVNKNLEAGSYQYNFDASNLTSGIYFYSISINGFTQVKKMNLIK